MIIFDKSFEEILLRKIFPRKDFSFSFEGSKLEN